MYSGFFIGAALEKLLDTLV